MAIEQRLEELGRVPNRPIERPELQDALPNLRVIGQEDGCDDQRRPTINPPRPAKPFCACARAHAAVVLGSAKDPLLPPPPRPR
jgi:hypothetical protein